MWEPGTVDFDLTLVTQFLKLEQEGEQGAVPVGEVGCLTTETPHARRGLDLVLYLCGRWQSSLESPLPSQAYAQCLRRGLGHVERAVGVRLRRCRVHAMCCSKVA